jgi:hypothetical protein
MIGAVATQRIALVARLVFGIRALERAQSQRCQQFPLDCADHRTLLILIQQSMRQTHREDLIRPQLAHRSIRRQHVVQAFAFGVPELRAEILAHALRFR